MLVRLFRGGELPNNKVGCATKFDNPYSRVLYLPRRATRATRSRGSAIHERRDPTDPRTRSRINLSYAISSLGFSRVGW